MRFPMLAILICASEAALVWSVSPRGSREVPGSPVTSHEGRCVRWTTRNKSVNANAANEANGTQRRREDAGRVLERSAQTDAGAGETFNDEANRAPRQISS